MDSVLEIGDYVKIAEPKDNLDDATNWLYGKVLGFERGGMMTKVELSKSYNGIRDMILPTYLAKPTTKAMYILNNYEGHQQEINFNTTKITVSCSHSWEKTGSSPITNEIWFNCKHCDIAKEEA